MRWLTDSFIPNSSPSDGRERGAVTALTAVLMVVLLLMVAMVVNTGMAYTEKAQLQNGADAAALAAANCTAHKTCNPGDAQLMAAGLVDNNSNDGHSNVGTLDFSVPGEVTVTTSTKSGANDFLTLPFAGLTHQEKGKVGAKATAAWSGGVPIAGPSILPLTFGSCQVFLGATDSQIVLHGKDDCKNNPSSGLNAPGGFGYLDADNNCYLALSAGQWVNTRAGNGISNECKTKVFIPSLIGKTVLVPIFGEVKGTGSGVQYKIVGWGAFVVSGWNMPPGPNKKQGKWTGSDDGIRGKFIEFLSYEDGFTYGQPKPGDPNFGVTSPTMVKLIK